MSLRNCWAQNLNLIPCHYYSYTHLAILTSTSVYRVQVAQLWQRDCTSSSILTVWVTLRLNFRWVTFRANISGPLDGEMVIQQLVAGSCVATCHRHPVQDPRGTIRESCPQTSDQIFVLLCFVFVCLKIRVILVYQPIASFTSVITGRWGRPCSCHGHNNNALIGDEWESEVFTFFCQKNKF